MMRILFPPLYFLIAAATAFNAFSQETIRIATGELPPYYSEKYQHYGQTLYLITQAFAQVKIEVEYGFFPWGRSYQLAKNNIWDASCCFKKTLERDHYFYYGDSPRTTDIVFFHAKNDPFDWSSFEDLKDIVIGTSVTYSYGKEFDNANKRGKLLTENAPTDEINFRKLLGGRIKIFPIDRHVGYQILADAFTAEEGQLLTHHPKSLVSYETMLLISKTNSKGQYFVKMFNKGLKMFKASNKYQQYLADVQSGEYNARE